MKKSAWFDEDEPNDLPEYLHEPLTKEELAAVASLKRLAKKWPPGLWLYAASGTLCVMKKDTDGEPAMDGEAVDGRYQVTNVDIECDGGDW